MWERRAPWILLNIKGLMCLKADSLDPALTSYWKQLRSSGKKLNWLVELLQHQVAIAL